MKKNPNSVLFRKKILLRMKLTIFLMILFTMQISASVSMHGQVTLNVQNESIRDVFKEIENQSPYRFFYNEAFADLNKRININVDDKDINSTMDELLLMSDMAYKVLDNNLVVIAPRKELQQHVVTGRVTDAATGEPLPGASVVIQGTTIGTTTGIDGDARQLLQGQLAGLTIIDKGGRPGAESITMNIRGITTLGSTSPLVIVDGIEQGLSDLNPHDIETITVLKDASSTAIYGSRAANGVILITTKRPKEGLVKVSYQGYFGLQRSNNNPVHMGLEDYMRMQNIAYTNSTGSPIYSEEYINEYVSATDRINYPLPNVWFDEMLRMGPQHSHTLSVAGGTENIKSYFSLRHMDQEGIIANYNSGLTEVRLNTDLKISEKLKVYSNFSYRQREREQPREAFNATYTMLQSSQWTVPVYPDGTYGISSDGHNPLMYAEQSGLDKISNSQLTGSLNIEYEILEGLTFQSQLAARINNGSNSNYGNKYLVRDYFNPEIIRKNVPRNYLTEGRNYGQEITINNLLGYSKIISNHSTNVLLGYSQISNESNFVNAYRQDFYNNEIRALNAGANDATKNNNHNVTTWGLRSYFGRLNYSYKNKYLLEGNARFDGSSRFYGDNKYSFFPSFSAGWRVSQEDFWSNLMDKINEFKFRGSYGKTGNQAIGLYSYFETLDLGSYVFGNVRADAYRQTTLANRDIQWETTTQANFGLDVQAYNNRITFSADYYKKRTDGILLTLPVPGTLGLSPSVQNAGIIDNKGWEFIVGTRNRFGDFGINVTAHLNINENVVVDLAGTGPYIQGDSEIRTITGEGYPFRGFWGYKTDGLFQTQEEVDSYPTIQAGGAPGDVKYLDLNNDGIISGEDMTFLGGSFFPKYSFGSNLNLTYKRFSLNMLFQGTAGTKRYIGGAIMQMGIWGGFTHEIFTDNYWTPENPDARFPRPEKFTVRNTQLSDRSIQDGSYLRLKNAQLMYQIPYGRLESMSIYISGTNLLTFSRLNEWNVDPESDNRDPEFGFPSTSIYSIGVNINF
jgi:TonB-linked SusC/RagA family outer membrane protein